MIDLLETGNSYWLEPATRSLEEAAFALGRLDASAALAPTGVAELLVLRCVSQAFGARREGMIALLRPESEGTTSLHRFLERLRETVPRDTSPTIPAIVSAAVAARESMAKHENDPDAVAAASLAASRALRAGGVIAGPWLSFPLGTGSPLSPRTGEPAHDSTSWLIGALESLSREARAAERGLGAARHRVAADTQRVRDSLGRAAYSALSVLEQLGERLVLNVPDVARTLGLTPPTANAAIARLEAMGIAREITGRERSRLFVYAALVDALAP